MKQGNSATKIAPTGVGIKTIEKPVWVFLDWSNIVIPAKDEAARREDVLSRGLLRVHAESLLDLARRGRTLAGGVAVGGPALRCVQPRLEKRGIRVIVSELGIETGTEQGVDETLQVRMMLLPRHQPPPATVVLMSGDGAGADQGLGFVATLQTLAEAGYEVEGMSWQSATSDALSGWLGSRHRFLDPHYREITFLEGGRRPEPLNLAKARLRSPRSREGRSGVRRSSRRPT